MIIREREETSEGNRPEVQTPEEFLNDFTTSAQGASRRIWVQVMYFEAAGLPKRVEDVLTQGAKRGIDVRVNIDWYTTQQVEGAIPFLPALKKEERNKRKMIQAKNKDLLRRLRVNGVKVTITNSLGVVGEAFPPLGYLARDHRKSFVVDETLWVGGLNLSELDLRALDFVVKLTNPAVVTAITKQFGQVNEKRPRKDYLVDCDLNYRLLVDAGAPGKSLVRGTSLIYQEALQMVKGSQKQITLVSQVVPDGSLLESLKTKAREGITVKIYTSSREAYRSFPPFERARRSYLRKTKGTNMQLFHHPERRVHAKLLLVDNEALLGSHNLTGLSIRTSTQELALHTRDPQLVGQLQEFVRSLQ